MSKANRFVGSPVERLEDLRLLRGRGRFVDDLTAEGVLNAVILRSPIAHGVIKGIDTSAARAMPGVVAVITAEETGRPVPTIPIRLFASKLTEPLEQPCLADRKVRYVGEPVVVVVAESQAIAEDACDAIVLDIEALPPVVTREAAEKGESLLFDELGTNRCSRFTALKGDADEAFRNAAYRRRERFTVHRHTAVFMEPRGLLAEWFEKEGKLVVQGGAKVPFATRKALSKQLNLPEDKIEVHEADTGGGFGSRGEFYPEDFLIPFAARFVGKPVKWIEDRREHLACSNHSRETEVEAEIACDKNGMVLGLRGTAYVDSGAYVRTNGLINPRNVSQFMSGPYHVPNINIVTDFYLSNRGPVGTYRGPGRYETDYVRERLFDMAATDMGIDRVEFRRRNLVRENQMPYQLPQIVETKSGDELDSGNYEVALNQCLAEFKWAEKVEKYDGKLIDGRYHGLGLHCFIEGGAAGPKENARLVLEKDGSVSVYVGSSQVGQGVVTVLTQIAADALEMPMDKIAIYHGSTTGTKEGFGSFHSRSTVMGGSAIVIAAASLQKLMREAAGRRFNCAPGDVTLGDGKAQGPGGKSLTFTELAEEDISIEESFFNHKHTWAYGTHATHIAVDPRTGQVEVLEYLAVEDVGRMVNPLTLGGQALGAIVQGLGGTFLEHLIYDGEGQLLTGTFADYLLPTAGDFPRIRTIMTGDYPSPINPLGVKGAGEGGIIPVGGIMANAIASALRDFGVQPMELPLSPPRIWKLIDDARPAEAAE